MSIAEKELKVGSFEVGYGETKRSRFTVFKGAPLLVLLWIPPPFIFKVLPFIEGSIIPSLVED